MASSSSAAAAAPSRFLSPFAAAASRALLSSPTPPTTRRRLLLSTTTTIAAAMAAPSQSGGSGASSSCKVVDSHLHVWASPQQAKEGYPYFPGQEATLRGDADFLLECMGEAGVDGALIVQPINHMFDHSLVTSVLKKYPSKFIGCCLANPADDGSGIKQLEHLIVQEKYRAVRFNPNLWPSGQKMTNEVGRSLFAKAGELGAPVGIMTMKGIGLYIQEIEELCRDYPKTTVILDHMAFCKPPMNDEEEKAFSSFLKLSKFPQVYVKYSALFRISREAYPYEDTAQLLSRVISNYGANRIMWGSDFPYVVPECGYKGAKEAVLSHKSSRNDGSRNGNVGRGTTILETMIKSRAKVKGGEFLIQSTSPSSHGLSHRSPRLNTTAAAASSLFDPPALPDGKDRRAARHRLAADQIDGAAWLPEEARP